MSNKWDIEYLKTQIKLLKLIDAVYNEAAREAALIGTNINIKDPERIFSFADYPTTKKRVDTLMNAFNKHIKEVMIKGINAAWGISNSKNDELCRKVHRDTQTSEQIIHCDTVRQAFIDRKTSGLNLSDRVWNYTTQFKNEIELSLDCGIRDGLSASEMSRELKQYLKYPDKLFRRVRDEHGILQLSKRAAAFHPGQGVYRSSYKNARRLAATETNIAYRTADHLRWQDMDFVVGIKVELSNNHTCLGADGRPHAFADICDDLQGKYPKDFKFVGWHPHCRCHATPILKTIDEMNADTRNIIQGGTPIKPTDSKNSVQQLPKVFSEWSKDNQQRIAKAKNIPYFIKDNFIQNKDGSLFPLIGYSCNTTKLKAFKKKARELLANKTFRDNITLSNRSIKEWLNQPHIERNIKDRALFNIENLLQNAEYKGSGIDKHSSKVIVHLYEILLGFHKSWIVVREFSWGRQLYSVSDNKTQKIKKSSNK